MRNARCWDDLLESDLWDDRPNNCEERPRQPRTRKRKR